MLFNVGLCIPSDVGEDRPEVEVDGGQGDKGEERQEEIVGKM